MVVVTPDEQLSLNIKQTYIPKSISQFLGEISMIGKVSEKLLKLDDFVNRLEQEMRTINKRHLPLTAVLINDAIDTLKEEITHCRKANGESVMEEFIPLKKSCDVDESDEGKKDHESRDKKNWMSSVQLWSNTDNQNNESNDKEKPNSLVEIIKKSEQENGAMTESLYPSGKSNTEGRAFMPFKGYPAVQMVARVKEEMPVPRLSLFPPGFSSRREELVSSSLSSKISSSKAVSSSTPNVQANLRTGSHLPLAQTSRKQRRCWDNELHRSFINALQQLGGAQVATPKQIRELMQVEGLTNDEVKSHLQKFRLHTRRVPANTAASPSAPAFGESKQSHSQSGSPEGPLQLTETTGGTSTTRGDSMEDEVDERSESYGWKTRIRTSGKDHV